ncbi:hypothetical protein [Rhizohabitans arisaemae]|uniref:hypothetical protein n=1 Tax=Rhizohabitans arisaemae TaxID=2720610 RepID=UPI0024B22B48|nr:hypothetical protein [Rhizohabitans arisaemae]
MSFTRGFRTVAAILAALGLIVAGPSPALAYPPVDVVHTERVQAGPYRLTVGFSTWPLRALQSLDFTFTPEGGIADKRGVLLLRAPGDGDLERIGRVATEARLARHPRKLGVWGLDTFALPYEGAWTLHFSVEGPAGLGEGELRNLAVLAQPGPPLGLSWALGTVPLWALTALLVVAWRRTGPARPAGVAGSP